MTQALQCVFLCGSPLLTQSVVLLHAARKDVVLLAGVYPRGGRARI